MLDNWFLETPDRKAFDLLLFLIGIGACSLVIRLVFNPKSFSFRGLTLNLRQSKASKLKEEEAKLKERDEKAAEFCRNSELLQLLESLENVLLYTADPVRPKDTVNDVFMHQCFFASFKHVMTDYIYSVFRSDGKELSSIIKAYNLALTETYRSAKTVKVNFIDEKHIGKHIIGLPDIYIAKFQHWDNEHISACQEQARDILKNGEYSTWENKLQSLLTGCTLMIQTIIKDVAMTLEAMNGDIDRAVDEMIRVQQHERRV